LFSRPISANMIGGAVEQESKNFLNMIVNELAFYYVHSIPSDQAGSIMLTYSPDPTVPTVDVGQDEILHAASNTQAEWTSVYADAALIFSPPKVEKNYYISQSNQDARSIYQGLFEVLVTEPILADKVCGDIFVHLDVTFTNERLAFEVEDVRTGSIVLEWMRPDAYVSDGGGLTFSFGGDVGWPPMVPIYNAIFNDPPDSANYDVVLTCRGYKEAGDMNGVLTWKTADDSVDRQFERGQTYFGEFENNGVNGAVNWGDNSISLFLTANSDAASPFQSTDWQLLDTTAFTGTQGAIVFDVYLAPKPSDQ